MFKGIVNRTAFISQIAQSVEHWDKNLKVEGSSPTVGKNFFILYFVAFDELLTCRLVPFK